MTPKSLLIAALSVGILLLRGTGAAPGIGFMAPGMGNMEMTAEEQAALDKQLEDLTVEDLQKYVKKQQLASIDWLEDNRDNIKLAIDEFVDNTLAALAKEPTAEEIAVMEKNLSNLSVADIQEYQSKSKAAMDKMKSAMEEVSAIFPAQQAPK